MRLTEKIINSALVQMGKSDYLLKKSQTNPVIMFYHGVSADLVVPNDKHVSYKTFKHQLLTLKKYFDFVKVEDVPEIIANGANTRPYLSVTFDDGYKNNYDVAAEIMSNMDIPATFFISTGYIDKKRWMWTDLLEYSILNTKKKLISIDEYNLKYNVKSLNDKHEAINNIKKALKAGGNGKIDMLIHSVSAELLDGKTVDPFGDYEFMTWSDVKNLHNSGFGIGAHTVNHPILSNIETSQAEHEIVGSKAAIIDEIGVCSNVFCYPNGKLNDYNADVIDVCKKNYSAALTTNSGSAVGGNMYELNRVGISDDMRGSLLTRRIINYAIN